MTPERRIVHYRGQVQGVGFRATTRRIAARFQVEGYVQNLPDGRVRVDVQGEPAEVQRFLRDIQERMRDYIHDTDVRIEAVGEEFDGFEVRF